MICSSLNRCGSFRPTPSHRTLLNRDHISGAHVSANIVDVIRYAANENEL